MKIRTDFVTNSSSSSFIVEIEFLLKDRKRISWREIGCDGEGAPVVGEIYVKVSPKQLGTAQNIQEMISLLKMGVWQFNDQDPDVQRILKSDVDTETGERNFDVRQKSAFEKAQRFIDSLKEIPSMDDIESVTIRGDEKNYVSYNRTFQYDRTTGKYVGTVQGDEFEKDGSSGGDLQFNTSDCNIICLPSYDDDSDIELDGGTTEERIAAYYCSGNEDNWFSISYTNAVLDEILKKYNYISDIITPPVNEVDIEGVIQGYCGVNTLEAFTSTLINFLINLGKADSGFEEEIKSRKDEIIQSFSSIEGTSVEEFLNVSDGISIGYDFEPESAKLKINNKKIIR